MCPLHPQLSAGSYVSTTRMGLSPRPCPSLRDRLLLLVSERLVLVGGFLSYFAPLSVLGRSCVPEAWVLFCLTLVGALGWESVSCPFLVVPGLCFLSFYARCCLWRGFSSPSPWGGHLLLLTLLQWHCAFIWDYFSLVVYDFYFFVREGSGSRHDFMPVHNVGGSLMSTV